MACAHSAFTFEQLEDRLALAADLLDDFFSLEAEGSPVASDAASPLSLTAQQGVQGSGVNMPEAHAAYDYRGSGYTVAVIDSGIDYLHPALGGSFGKADSRVVGGYDFVDGTSGSFVEGDSTPGADGDPMDYNGHGTNVAGIIGSSDDVYGGVAPEVDLVALRVLDKNGNGKWSWIDRALDWVIDHREMYNIVAINLSLGSGNYSMSPTTLASLDAKFKELYDLGVVIVASAGNNFYTNASTLGIQYPAISEWVVSVGAVFDGDYGSRTWSSGAKDFESAPDRITSFTQRSSALDLLAPGAIITSTYLSSGGQEKYASYVGTSQAAPFVTAASVLVREALTKAGKTSLINQSSIVDILQSTGVTLKDGDDEVDNVTNTGLSFRRLDLLAALDVASELPNGDRFESNNSADTATYLGSIRQESLDNLSLDTRTDTDWFAFHTLTQGAYRLQVTVNSGESAVELIFHDVSTNRSRDISADVINGVATIDVDLRTGVRYFLEVRSSSGVVSSYEIDIADLAAPPDPSSGPPGPDNLEPNDRQLDETYLGVVGNVTVDALTIDKSSDVDWFRFKTSIPGLRRIEVLAEGSGLAKFTFYDFTVGKERTLYSKIENGVAVLDVNLRTGVNYFVKIESADGKPLAYSIRLGLGADAKEPNESFKKSAFLGLMNNSTVSGLTLHTSTDHDWYRFNSVDGMYMIQVAPTSGSGKVSFVFYDVTKGKERTLTADVVNGVATLPVKLRSGVNYFLEVFSEDGSLLEYTASFKRVF